VSDSAGVSPDPTNRGGLPTLLVRLFVGGTLLYLGWKKTGDPHAFMKGIEQYGVLPLEPPQLINGVAVLLPFLEIAIGLSLIVGLLRRGGATISFFMLLFFTVLVARLGWNYHLDHPEISIWAIELDCGCGSGAENVVKKLLLNVALIGGSFWLMVSPSHRYALKPPCGT